MTTPHGGDLIADVLAKHGVKHVFTLCGGHISPILTGCQAKGMWLVDFDTGEGYYCWHYPEPEICYFHGYDEGFRGRVKIH